MVAFFSLEPAASLCNTITNDSSNISLKCKTKSSNIYASPKIAVEAIKQTKTDSHIELWRNTMWAGCVLK